MTLARGTRLRALAAVLVAFVAVAELLWWNVAFRLNADPRRYYDVLDKPPPAAAKALAVLDQAINARHAVGERPRVEVVGLGGPWQNVAVVRGLEARQRLQSLGLCTDRLVSPGEVDLARRSAAISLRRSTATTAPWRARSGLNSWC